MRTIAAIALAALMGMGLSFAGAAPPSAPQAACEARAYKTFPDYRRAPVVDGARSYRAHANADLGKCFVQLRAGSIDVGHCCGSGIQQQLKDAVSGTLYGQFVSHTSFDRDGRHAKTTIIQCDLTPPDSPLSHCTAQAEWDKYVAVYMGRS